MTGDRRVESFRSLAESILALPGGVRLVAVDGYGGAGKSTFAARLAAALGGAEVVHTDDFATGEPGVEWWPRLEREVIVPLSAGETARAMPAVVIEGVSSARRAAADRLAYAIWIDAPAELRLERGLERDGRDARRSGMRGWPRRTPTSRRTAPAPAATWWSTATRASTTIRRRSSC
jgi:hypothetical protein